MEDLAVVINNHSQQVIWITIFTKEDCNSCERTKNNVNDVVYDIVTKSNDNLIIHVTEEKNTDRFSEYPVVKIMCRKAGAIKYNSGFTNKTKIRNMINEVISYETK